VYAQKFDSVFSYSENDEGRVLLKIDSNDILYTYNLLNDNMPQSHEMLSLDPFENRLCIQTGPSSLTLYHDLHSSELAEYCSLDLRKSYKRIEQIKLFGFNRIAICSDDGSVGLYLLKDKKLNQYFSRAKSLSNPETIACFDILSSGDLFAYGSQDSKTGRAKSLVACRINQESKNSEHWQFNFDDHLEYHIKKIFVNLLFEGTPIVIAILAKDGIGCAIFVGVLQAEVLKQVSFLEGALDDVYKDSYMTKEGLFLIDKLSNLRILKFNLKK